MGNPWATFAGSTHWIGGRMRKVQATITLQVLNGAGVPDGVPEGGTVCCTGYADGSDLSAVLDAAKADAVERVRAARAGEIPPAPRAHDLHAISRPPWRCPCDLARFDD